MNLRFLRAAIVALLLVTSFSAAGPPPAQAVTVAFGPTDVYGTAGGGALTGTAVSSTNTYYSLASNLQAFRFAAYDLYWGTNVGTFTVQVSNKANPITTSDADWKSLTLARPITQPSGVTGGDYVDLSNLPFKWVRLKYVNASGSGNIQAFLFGKE